MPNANPQREKLRRRQKRLAKRQRRSERPDAAMANVLRTLDYHAKVPPPTTWPGATHASLVRPDMVKYELSNFAAYKEPGKTKLRRLEHAARRGLAVSLPDLDHWVLEKFFWHGTPGDAWHPIDAFLVQSGARFPPVAQEQLRLWKSARLGIFEIGTVHDDVLDLRTWDAASGTAVEPAFRAITLNIGGVNLFQEDRGKLLLTYLAPWSPAEQLYCGMGYSSMTEKGKAAPLAVGLALLSAEMALGPVPWKAAPAAARAYLRAWDAGEWHSWLAARLQFPFQALVPMGPNKGFVVHQVTRLCPSTPDQARRLGVYLDVPTASMVAGASQVLPLDAASPNVLPLAEYRAYRDVVGPPPTMRGQPDFLTLR